MKCILTKLGIVAGLVGALALSATTPTLARSNRVVTGADRGYYSYGSAYPSYGRGYYGPGDAWDRLRQRNASPSWAG